MFRRTSAKPFSQRRGNARERGYVLFTMAAAIVSLCGFAGLVVDVGYGEFMRRQAQAAADAGAKAAAFKISSGSTDSSAIAAAAKQDTANNGFTDGSNNVTVTVNYPPNSGNYSANGQFAEVIVTKSLNTSFMGALGFSSMNVSARSVGGTGPGTGCVYVMDPSASKALTVSGSGKLQTSCGVWVNSNNSDAMNVSGSAGVCANDIEIVGNYSNSGSGCGGTGVSPTPVTGINPFSDPLAYVQAPAVGGCDHTGTFNGNGLTLNPGVYCGGISVSGGNSATFNSGTYILLGGGLTVSGGSSITGTGVTFYNTGNGTYSYKPIVVSGGSATNLSAPTSGSLSGVLFFQDRSISNNSQNTISGGSGAVFTGVMYFPSTPLVYSGGSTTPGGPYTEIIAKTLTISGASAFGADYSSLSSGNPIRNGAIVAE